MATVFLTSHEVVFLFQHQRNTIELICGYDVCLEVKTYTNINIYISRICERMEGINRG